MSIESIQLPSPRVRPLIETPEKGKGWEKLPSWANWGGGGGEPAERILLAGKENCEDEGVHVVQAEEASEEEEPIRSRHERAVPDRPEPEIAVELDDLSYSTRKPEARERLRDLREGIEVLESGLRSRSEESMACLGRWDRLTGDRGQSFGLHRSGEGGRTDQDFRHLSPDEAGPAELRVKVNFGSGAQPPTPERPSTTELEGRSFAGPSALTLRRAPLHTENC